MVYNISFLFLVFFIYSFIGYIVEIISVSTTEKKIIFSRGYLIGPYLPIFGFGAIIMIGYLSKYRNDFLTLFILSMVICCTLEYLTSLFLEKIFKLRWWDYSNKKFNVNGRVCLENGILFGVGGLIIVQYFNPRLISFLTSFSHLIIIVLGIVFFSFFLIDFLISTFIIFRLKIGSTVYANSDSTIIIRKQVIDSLQKYRILHKRLYRSFPNILNSTNIVNLREAIENRREANLKKNN